MFAFLALVALLAVPVAAWQVHRNEVAHAPAPVAEVAPLPGHAGKPPGMRPGAHGQAAGKAGGPVAADAQARLGPPPGARLTPEQLRERHAGKLPPAKFKGQVPGPRAMASADGASGAVTEGAAGARPRPQGGMRARSAAPGTATATGASTGTTTSAYPDSAATTGAATEPTAAPATGSYPDSSTVAPSEEVTF